MGKVNIVMLQGKDQTDRIFLPKHLRQLEELGNVTINDQAGVPSPERLKELLAEADIAITSWGVPLLEEDILAAAPRLKAVMHAAGTVKAVVTPALWQRGIRVTGARTALGKGVAETALGFTIASVKNMWQLAANTRAGEWFKDKEKTRELYELTIGVVGAGQAGRFYIDLVRNFDVDILLYDPTVSAEEAAELGTRKVELEELLRESDVVSLHAPSLPSTRHMINAERLKLMKDDAILINTARGALIDEAALVAELQKGRLFACIDVTDPEPPAADHPFRSLPNVVLTPHIAGSVTNGLHRIAQYIVDEVRRYLAGERMDGEVEESQLSVLA